MTSTITLYIDFKCPYSYLSLEPEFQLAETHDIDLQTRPFVSDIPGPYGDLKSRDELQSRKVRYLYQDVRRFAN
ncbi:MAG: hypothetical protein CFH35_01289 [Alphaproteobacteria bacterium MarineAlpha9_Bin5]|nr:MAG: hypothetical protein CFH35_01289 [Alphaproteobacteria bacterium MarineAlpha9_Bin5]